MTAADWNSHKIIFKTKQKKTNFKKSLMYFTYITCCTKTYGMGSKKTLYKTHKSLMTLSAKKMSFFSFNTNIS